MFVESELPLDPNDTAPKPNVGDTLKLKEIPFVSEGGTYSVRAWLVFDSLAESWDPVGEHAWQQHDINDIYGHRGRWYAVVEDPKTPGETWSVASWEVALVQRNSDG